MRSRVTVDPHRDSTSASRMRVPVYPASLFRDSLARSAHGPTESSRAHVPPGPGHCSDRHEHIRSAARRGCWHTQQLQVVLFEILRRWQRQPDAGRQACGHSYAFKLPPPVPSQRPSVLTSLPSTNSPSTADNTKPTPDPWMTKKPTPRAQHHLPPPPTAQIAPLSSAASHIGAASSPSWCSMRCSGSSSGLTSRTRLTWCSSSSAHASSSGSLGCVFTST